MLTELAVENLGVIERLNLVLGSGMTALTGETGAGKTLVVTAVDLLLGGRADPSLVRFGADEATVEGRFDQQGEEVVLRRVVPADGRARAYVDGRLASAATLAELGAELVDLHGQHDHQSLLRRVHQRAALDRFGGVDLAPLMEARASLADLNRRRAELGGDERSRAREIELCRFQLAELDEAGLEDPDEEEGLKAEEAVLPTPRPVGTRPDRLRCLWVPMAQWVQGWPRSLPHWRAGPRWRASTSGWSTWLPRSAIYRRSCAVRPNPLMRILSGWPRSASVGSCWWTFAENMGRL
ncbi:AAA family ATPase [Candidatus Poriferisocius sp.]|uniref:AAA family ATPase n=1 Tax=Candidatus Poriferisocius sp. TaxID=3101276 RepID=UPI003B010AD2